MHMAVCPVQSVLTRQLFALGFAASSNARQAPESNAGIRIRRVSHHSSESLSCSANRAWSYQQHSTDAIPQRGGCWTLSDATRRFFRVLCVGRVRVLCVGRLYLELDDLAVEAGAVGNDWDPEEREDRKCNGRCLPDPLERCSQPRTAS
eukprot:2895923-Rhodomonas_salina.1